MQKPKGTGNTRSIFDASEGRDSFVGTLKYRGIEVGIIDSLNLPGLRSQFQTISEIIVAGGMVRRGIIMLGYHNKDLHGDVLLVDGEVLGSWHMDDEEWCHFQAEGGIEVKTSAPSPWMLHDAIADWVERKRD